MCILCRDTFSRSDILKRHFQKCSLRRGNPTGASHLSHSQAHLRKSHPGPHRPPGSSAGNPQPSSVTTGTNGFGITSFSATSDSMVSTGSRSVETLGGQISGQNQLLSPNGMQIADDGLGNSQRKLPVHGSNESHRASLTEANNESSHAIAQGAENPNTAFSVPPASQYPSSFAYDPGSNVESFTKGSDALAFKQAQLSSFDGSQSNQGNELDWPNLYIPNGSDGYNNNPMFPSQLPQAQMPIKADPGLEIGPYGAVDDQHNHLLQGLYATPMRLGTNGLPSTFSNWNFDLSADPLQIPLQSKTDRVITFCANSCGHSTMKGDIIDELKKILTVDNVKHFVLERFTSFQGYDKKSKTWLNKFD